MTESKLKQAIQEGIGSRLKMARKTAGLTQEKMAEHVGILQGNVSQYELGNTMPKLPLIVSYGIHCNIDIAWLLKGEGFPAPNRYKIASHPLPYPMEMANKYSETVDVSNLAVAGRFRTIRKLMKMSQHEFADMLPYSRTSTSYWESGRALPRVDHILDVAARINCNAEWLAFGIAKAWPQK